jgi:alkaline phosphatase
MQPVTDRGPPKQPVGAGLCARPLAVPARADTEVRPYSSWFGAPRLVLFSALLAGCSDSVAAPQDAPAAPKSVILLIGDGTGPQQLGLLMDWADAAGKSPTAFERLANAGTTGVLKTAAADSPLTDSAAGATALACGVSTVNGAISVDASGKKLTTCLEDARAKGRRTGLVTTTTITHATPACFAAHIGDRGEEAEIASQYIAEGLGADVMFGGGRRSFSDALLAQAGEKGWKLVATREELAALPAATPKALGLFSKGQVPYAIDRDAPGEAQAPSLADMTRKALELLSQGDKGFFLMVEGGRIDHACHGNDAAAALGELREFDDAIALCEEFRAKHPDTLVIVTADHETGGLTVTTGNPPSVIAPGQFLALAKVEKSVESMGLAGRVPKDFDPAKFGLGHVAFYPPNYWVADSIAIERSAQYCVTFSTSSHSTTPVLIAAAGPGAAAFNGVQRNTIVGAKLREWMGR